MDEDELRREVRELLRLTVATRQRRIANRRGVRECRQVWHRCRHTKHWNITLQMCDNCGITKKNIIEMR